MREMVFDLLGSLNICKLQANFGQAIDVIELCLFLLLQLFYLQAHIAANTSDLVIALHVPVHLLQGVSIWL